MIERQLMTSSVAMMVLLWGLNAASPAAESPSTTANPDFTQGDQIPEGATHDWNLGPTGARGWMYSNKMETSEARQIYVTKVDRGLSRRRRSRSRGRDPGDRRPAVLPTIRARNWARPSARRKRRTGTSL